MEVKEGMDMDSPMSLSGKNSGSCAVVAPVGPDMVYDPSSPLRSKPRLVKLVM
jgi:hypothetical protein